MRILTVCTGNICRSALAESLLRQKLDPQAFTVSSAGVRAVVGGKVPPQQVAIGVSLGVEDLPQHSGSQITEQDVRNSDLILVATRDHRGEVVRLDPSASTRTFTYREFAHLAKSVTLEDIEELTSRGVPLLPAGVAAVAQQRGQTTPVPEYDTVDPYGHDKATYDASAAQLVPAVEDTVKYLKIVSGLKDTVGGVR